MSDMRFIVFCSLSAKAWSFASFPIAPLPALMSSVSCFTLAIVLLALSYIDGSFKNLPMVPWPEFTSSIIALILSSRSEERRVGKECRSRWWQYHENEKEKE